MGMYGLQHYHVIHEEDPDTKVQTAPCALINLLQWRSERQLAAVHAGADSMEQQHGCAGFPGHCQPQECAARPASKTRETPACMYPSYLQSNARHASMPAPQAWRAPHTPQSAATWLEGRPKVHSGFLRAWQHKGYGTRVLDFIGSAVLGDLTPDPAGGTIYVTGVLQAARAVHAEPCPAMLEVSSQVAR